MTQPWIKLAAGGDRCGTAVPASAQTPLVNAAREAGRSASASMAIWLCRTADAQLRSQVGAINIRRRALYSRLATTKGVAPHEVGITAGCQLLARVSAGHAYLLIDGQWRRRAPGQALPIPDYCR